MGTGSTFLLSLYPMFLFFPCVYKRTISTCDSSNLTISILDSIAADNSNKYTRKRSAEKECKKKAKMKGDERRTSKGVSKDWKGDGLIHDCSHNCCALITNAASWKSPPFWVRTHSLTHTHTSVGSHGTSLYLLPISPFTPSFYPSTLLLCTGHEWRSTRCAPPIPISFVMQSKMMSKPNTTRQKKQRLWAIREKTCCSFFFKQSPERQSLVKKEETQILCTKGNRSVLVG